MYSGSEFTEAAAGKARLPTVDSLTDGQEDKTKTKTKTAAYKTKTNTKIIRPRPRARPPEVNKGTWRV